jgi:hypothetical protein
MASAAGRVNNHLDRRASPFPHASTRLPHRLRRATHDLSRYRVTPECATPGSSPSGTATTSLARLPTYPE